MADEVGALVLFDAAHLSGMIAGHAWQQPLADGSYPAPPQNASGHTWHHTDTELFVTVRDGDDPGMAGKASVMPAFGKTLGDSDIVAVLAFIKSNWPPDVLSAQERLSEETRHAHH